MLKVKNSLLAKISAIVLVVALILGTVPMELLSVNAAVVERGSVTTIAEVGGEVDSTDPMNVQVKYEGEIVIARLGANEEKGRETEGWYVGALMTVPSGIDYDFVQYTNGDEVTSSFASLGNVESFYMWQSVKKSDYDAAAGGVLTYTWVFDWNTQADGTVQNVVFSIDTSKVTLSDKDTVAPTINTPVVNPSTWTNGDVEVSGTVNDNFSGVKAVYYKKAGTDTTQIATLTGNTYSFTIGAESYEGEYVVWCEDNKGNKSDEVIASVKMDNVQPTITAKADITGWTNKKVVISGTAIDAESGVKALYYQKGSESKAEITSFDRTTGAFEFVVAAQEYAGDYTVSCVDAAGNESKTTVAVKMDNGIPELTKTKADITEWTNGSVVISGVVNDATSGVSKIYYKQGEDGDEVGIENKGGTFEFTIDPQEYEGNYLIYCVDAAGNKNSATVAVKMDNGKCVVVTGEASCKEWTNKGVTISGTVSDNLSGVVSVSWRKADESATGEAVLSADSYSFDVEAQDYDGIYKIICKDRAGNESLKFDVSVKMDKTAPVVGEPTVNPNKWTNEQVVITGKVSDNLSGVTTVKFRKADSTVEETAALDTETNKYTITLPADDYEGAYLIYCTDKAGNKSAKVIASVKMDKTVPTVEVPTVSTEKWTNGQVVISGAVSDALSKVKSVTCVKTGTSESETVQYDDVTGTYSITLEAQNYYGTYTITCEDNAGNTVETTTETVQMDIEKPELENIAPIYNDGDWVNTAVTITGNATDPKPGVNEVSDIAKVYFKKGENGTEKEAIYKNGKFEIPIPAQSYKGTYVIYCVDNAGNRSEDSVINVYMDNEQCKILSAEATISNWTNKDVVIYGKVWDNLSGIESVTYKQENAEKGETVQVSKVEEDETGYTYSYSITIPAQNYDGVYTLSCKDLAGNEVIKAEYVSVKMDIEKPVVTEASANPSDWYNRIVTISGKVEDPKVNGAQSQVVSYTYKKGDGEETEPREITTTDEGEKIFSFDLEPDDYEGTYTIYCKDAAGNKSKGKTVDVYMDKTAPTAKIKHGDNIWEEIIEELTLMKFFRDVESFKIEADDNLSGIKKIEYAEKNVVGVTKLDENDVVNIKDWKECKDIKRESGKVTTEISNITAELSDAKEEEIKQEGYDADIVQNIVVCVRVTDFAGNQHHITTDGLIFDAREPEPLENENKIIYPKTIAKGVVEASGRALFGGKDESDKTLEEVIFGVAVSEESVDNALQSGIKSITYTIEARDREDTPIKETKEGTLYPLEGKSTGEDKFSGKILVNAKDFNYNYVDLTVKVVDNAGNETTETYEFAIDITAPTVSIDYVDEDADTSAKDVFEDAENTIYGCYTNERQAKITYTERTENWNRPSNTDIVTALDITGTEMEHGVAYKIDWEDKEGSTSDDDTHVATVTFHAEKDDTTKYKDARYDINTTCKDAAGNASLETTTDEKDKYQFHFIIDTVSPEINVEDIKYSEHVIDKAINALTFNYYNNNVNVTVRMKDMTSGVKLFDYEGLLDSNISNKNKEVIKTIIETQDIKALTAEGTIDQLTGEFEVNFSIPKEALTELNSFRGTVKVNAFDYCGNSTEVHDATRLVVDKIAPKGEVTFDAPVKEADGVSYYDGNFTATIVIDEANFYAEDVDIRVNDTRVYPSDWTQNGDVWTSHVTFTGENDYVLKVNYTDRSGNVMTPYESNQKTLDTTEPVITVTNLNHESANNDETIGFVLTVTDKNMALADIKPQVTAVIRKGDNSSNYTYETIAIDLGTPSVSTNANGETVYTYVVNNLEIDGYYSIVCTATDHANHTVSNIGVSGENGRSSAVETMNFSVNREGSVFWIETEHTDKYTDETFKDELDGAYANDQVIVKLHEINVDKVDDSVADDKRTVFTLNDGSESNTIKLVEKVNGTGNYERNVELGQGGWYKTTYTLDNDQFKNDGTYSLNIITYDKAENSNVNTKSEEGTIKFVVDRTNPVITSNVKNEQSIKENEYTVEFKIADVNLDPTTVVVKLDGKEIKCKEVGTGTYQFTLDEAQWANFPRLSQNFEIEAKDLAGNSAEIYEREDITVTDDVFIQAAAYMINHPLLLGLSAAGLVAVIGFFIFFIILKRRKEEQ